MICKALGAILLIGGMIGAIIITKQLGFLSAISVYIMALVLPVILLAIAEILENQEYIIALNKQISPKVIENLEKELDIMDTILSLNFKNEFIVTNRFKITYDNKPSHRYKMKLKGEYNLSKNLSITNNQSIFSLESEENKGV